MNGIKKGIIFAVAFLVMIDGAFYAALADPDGYKNRRRYQKRSRNKFEHHSKEYLTPVNNQTYIGNCGACHFAYQPELLPSESWNQILAGLDDHFGETVDLDKDSEKTIAEYLKANSAEHSRNERSVKIMRSLGDNIPMRITEIPYIQAKHRKINQDVFQRESIGSLSNCSACHVTADKGIYEDGSVKIPQ